MTTDIGTIRKDAISLATQAIQYDDEKNFEEAIKCYYKAGEKLNYLIKIDESKLNQETYKKKAKEYLERAMELKGAVSGEDKKQAVPAGGQYINFFYYIIIIYNFIIIYLNISKK
jgi:MIT (microtubule interacting and transport) domain